MYERIRAWLELGIYFISEAMLVVSIELIKCRSDHNNKQ